MRVRQSGVICATLFSLLAVSTVPGWAASAPCATSNGRVFVAANIGGSSANAMYEFNPTANTFSLRADFEQGRLPALSALADINASGDRSVIGITGGNSSPTTLYRYVASTNSFGLGITFRGPSQQVAFNRTGSIAYTGEQGYVFDASLNMLGSTGGITQGVAVDPDGTTGYAAAGQKIVSYDLRTFRQNGAFPMTAATGTAAANGRLAISQDGALVAVTTSRGFEIVRVKGQPIYPAIHFVGFSSSQLNESILRFFNADSQNGTAKITLFDVGTKAKLAEWTTPAILPGTAPQFTIASVEAMAAPADRRPNYLVELQPTFRGTFAHILWQRNSALLTNASSCETGISATTQLVNVHSSLLDDSSPSYLAIMNAGTAAAAPALGIYNALTGVQVATYTGSVIEGKSARLIAMADVETAAQINAARGPYYHYIIKIQNAFDGSLQHLLGNRLNGAVTDLTKVCPLQ